MPWRVYLELSAPLAKANQAFLLVHQDIEDGIVKFRTTERLRMFNEILNFHNGDGAGNATQAAISAHKKIAGDLVRKLKLHKWPETLQNVTGPNAQGFYRARCFACDARGNPDEKGHGLSFHTDGRIACFRGCSYKQLIEVAQR